MVGLVVATHGRLAEELLATVEQIVGELPQVAACSIKPGMLPLELREKVRDAVRAVDSGEGALVLADILGGTPCKESLMLCGQCHIEVLAGVNVPMLLKASSLRSEPLALPDMARALAQHAQKNITCASDLLREAQVPRSH